jgi:Fe-S oxidoreductase
MNPVSGLGIIGFILFWGLTALAAVIFLFRASQIISLVRLGKPEKQTSFGTRKLIFAVGHFIAQQCQFKNVFAKDRAPIGHVFMMWGFLVFATYYFFFIIIASGFGVFEFMEHNAVYVVFCWIMDIVGPIVVIGAAWGLIRRYIVRPERIQGQQTFEALIILLTVLLHPITHIGKIATQIAAGVPPAGLGLPTPPLSAVFANLYPVGADLPVWHAAWFWAHWGFVLVVLAIIGFTRYFHIVAAIPNEALRPPRRGMLRPLALEDETTFGVGRVDNFTQKQLLDTMACMTCCYCQDNCPATRTGKPLNPRLIIRDIKINLMKNGPLLGKKLGPALPLIGSEVKEGSNKVDSIWSCTTCWACMEMCPIYIEHVPKIIDMRRYLVQMEAKFPVELLNFFENVEQRSNPWGIAPADRTKWTADLNVPLFEKDKTEYLFYVGCFGSFDARSKKTAVAITQILNATGISWGILGKDEKCCGDSMRRLGNEYIFDKMATENIKFYQDKGVKKIITLCPHCFTTFKNDYRQYGATFEVVDHTEFIDHLLKEGKLKLSRTDLGNVVLHDSCYLGRHSGIYEEPRSAVRAATGKRPTEMERNHRRSFCCGGGGGRIWMEENLGTPINHTRVEEALRENPDTICVACPYCKTMFLDGLKDKGAGDKVQVLDVAEIVAKALR